MHLFTQSILCTVVVGLTSLMAFHAVADPLPAGGVRSVVDARSGVTLQIQPRPAAEVSFDRLMSETQRMSDAPDSMAMVWWLPVEFWKMNLSQDPTVAPQAVQEAVQLLGKYMIFTVVDGEIGPFGGVTYVDEEQVRRSVAIRAGNQTFTTPLDHEDLDPDVQQLLRVMKPMMQQMAGELGQNMHFVVYAAPQGPLLLDPTRFGELEVSVGDESFTFGLPLPSLLQDKHCPKCDRDFRGDYAACPYDRTGLIFSE